MVVTAQYKDAYYTVKFMDLDGNVISEQSVKYGESAEVPEVPELKDNDTEFATWSSMGE